MRGLVWVHKGLIPIVKDEKIRQLIQAFFDVSFNRIICPVGQNIDYR